MKRNLGNQKERNKVVLKRRKISPKAISQWKPLTKEKKSTLIAALQDSVDVYTGSDDKEINEVLSRIKQSFRQLLQVMKVPDDNWMDPKAIHSYRAKLVEELRESETLESQLLSTLEDRKRDVKKKESEINQLNR